MAATILVVAIVLTCNPTDRYVKNYFTVAGIHFWTTYDSLVRRLGEPVEIIPPISGVRRHYEIHFSDLRILGSRQNGSSFGIVEGTFGVIGPGIRFGSHQIGVGSTREEVELAYWRSFENPRGVQINTEHELVLVDGIAWVYFFFDGNGVVEKITVTGYGP